MIVPKVGLFSFLRIRKQQQLQPQDLLCTLKGHALGPPKGYQLPKIARQHMHGQVGLTRVKGQSKEVLLSTAFSHQRQSSRHIRVQASLQGSSGQFLPAPFSSEGQAGGERRFTGDWAGLQIYCQRLRLEKGLGMAMQCGDEGWDWTNPVASSKRDQATARQQPSEGQGMISWPPCEVWQATLLLARE